MKELATMILNSDDLEATADEIVEGLRDQAGDIQSVMAIGVSDNTEDTAKLKKFGLIFKEKIEAVMTEQEEKKNPKRRSTDGQAEAEAPSDPNSAYVSMADLSREDRKRLSVKLTVGEILAHSDAAQNVLVSKDYVARLLVEQFDDA